MEKLYKLYSSLPELEQYKTRADIDLTALRYNYRYLKTQFLSNESRPRIISVVKADAYGHGAPECIRVLLEEGCDFFAVSCIDEAVAVRNVCDRERKKADVLILGYTDPSLAAQLARYDIIQTLLSADYARLLNHAAQGADLTVRIHVALDTGMNRIGFPAYNGESAAHTAEELLRVSHYSHLHTEGIFTHFARADEDPGSEGDTFTELQYQRFLQVCHALERQGMPRLFRHACNSAAAVRSADYHLDGVRLGIVLYGTRPAEGFDLPLRPVMKLKTVISHVHTLPPGEAVGYGGAFCADSERRIATLPIGYADGLLRGFSGGTVTVHTHEGDRRVPIVGRICMDQCMMDVTGTEACVGGTVTLFGNHPRELSDYATRASTIDYECLCLISSRVPRRYAEDKDGTTQHTEV